LKGQNDGLLVTIVHVLMKGPGWAQPGIALLPLDLGRLVLIFVLHNVETDTLDRVIDGK
jgi:hypothetical protein